MHLQIIHGYRSDFVPAWALGRASMQERWGLPSDRVTVTASKESMKVPSVDTSTERRALARPPRRGICEDPGRDQLCTVTVHPDA